MIKFYYTTVKGLDEKQIRSDLSLGGFKSSSVVPNDVMNNLFSDLSIYSVNRPKDEYIAIIAVNESVDDLADVNIWFEYPTNCQRKYQVAAVDLVNGQMEYIDNTYQRPYSAEFYEADGVANKVSLGTLDAGVSIGIWLKTSTNIDNINTEYSDENIELNGNPKEADESINIKLEY